MAQEKHSGIAAELSFALRDHPKTVVKWEELGKLGGHRVRHIQYFLAPTEEFASFIVIERNPTIFAPLMKWAGSPMPLPKILVISNTNVLVTAADFGGNVPMVTTWAWVWTSHGPMRIEVEKAVQEAIEKVVPGHSGYNTGISWDSLSTVTYSWGTPGYPGKVGVEETVKAWFNLRGNRLVVKRVEWENHFNHKHWP